MFVGAVKRCLKCDKDDFVDKLKSISKGRLLFCWGFVCSHVVLGEGYKETFGGRTRTFEVREKLTDQCKVERNGPLHSAGHRRKTSKCKVERNGPLHSAHVLGGIQCPGLKRSKLEDGITYEQVDLELG